MTENKYNKKAEEKLLVAIYHKYVKDQGDQPAQLDVYHFNAYHDYLYKATPEILLELLGTKPRPSADHRYYMNLKDYGYIVNVNNIGIDVFKLTKPGFYEEKRLIHPCRHLFIKHWKYIIPIGMTFIGVILTIIRLTRCP